MHLLYYRSLIFNIRNVEKIKIFKIIFSCKGKNREIDVWNLRQVKRKIFVQDRFN